MKVAIVHDWLVTYAGAEKVLEQILQLYPEADIYSLVDFLPDNQRDFIMHKKVHTSFMQNLPKVKTRYRSYLALMPLAIEQFDLRGYDLIISSSHCVAKGVLTGPNQVHISYVHSPVRYAWDLQGQYLKEAGLTHGAKSWIAKAILHYIRIWDTRTANGVDYFLANSHFITKRIWKCYRREADVIYPPVDINKFVAKSVKEDFYLTASRMVPYKKINLIVDAFTQMPDKKLVVIGDGPDFAEIKAQAGKNVEMLGYQPDEVLQDYMQRAKAFVFAAEEDFGIVPVEAQASGTPVIAFGRGGALETVNDLTTDAPTGVFFKEQTSASLKQGVVEFEANQAKFTPENCRHNAEKFSINRFKSEFKNYVDTKLRK